MNRISLKLRADLKKFGLNPADWKLQRIQRRIYKIAHTHDQEFYFLGEIKLEGLSPQWSQITLTAF